MFVCLECRKVFTSPIRWKEDRGECFGFPSYEEYWGSPCCHSNYTEAYECDCCGKWITGDYIKTDNGERYCENCIVHYELGEE